MTEGWIAVFSYICLAFLTFLPIVTNLFSFFLANIVFFL